MVEGYTDNVPINSKCTPDNWALSVQRSTAVVRVLQEDYEIDPNRLIAAGRHTEAFMLNWESNVFPGILGRTCDRPCEPACPILNRCWASGFGNDLARSESIRKGLVAA